MIGIIGAMQMEVDGLLEKMTDVSVINAGMMKFFSGKIEGRDVVVARCGVGKVNAGACAQAMILLFSPDVVINTGIAGGLEKTMKVCDCVIADGVCQHDYDTTPIGDPLAQISLIDRVIMDCDEDTITKLKESATEVCGERVFIGRIATGDCFVNGGEKAEQIKNVFGAIACEMEGGAVGQVCCMNDIPFAVIRTISDGGDDGAGLSFAEFAKRAADISIQIVLNFIKK